jgi:hypothetical protein
MRTTLRLDSLHLTLRGVPVATATAAVRGLGPALKDKLAGGVMASGAEDSARVSRDVSALSLRNTIASRVAGALRPHLPPNQS